MEPRTKQGIIVVGGLVFGTGLAVLLAKRAKAAPEEGEGEVLAPLFSGLSVKLEPYAPAPGWKVPLVTCTVQNPHEQELSTTLYLVGREFYFLPGVGDQERIFLVEAATVDVVIDPQGMYTYVFDGQVNDGPLLAGQINYGFTLMDAAGNESEEVVVAT